MVDKPKLNETRFDSYQDFINTIRIGEATENLGIFILNINDIPEEAIDQFDLYRNEFYEINVCRNQKEFQFWIDGSLYKPDGTPFMCFVAPNQLQSYKVLGEDIDADGYLIHIRKDIVHEIRHSLRDFSIFHREFEPFHEISKDRYHEVERWIKLMISELGSNENVQHKHEVLKSLLTVLLLKCQNFCTPQQSALYAKPKQILDQFIQLLDENKASLNITEYSSRLALSTKQLNSLCKSLLGKTAKQFSKEHLNREAKALLRQSDYQVSEIAAKLGFEEVSNFSRFFKSMNGVSPKAFILGQD